MPIFPISTYIMAGLLVALLALGGYTKILSSKNDALEAQKAQIISVNKSQAESLSICSENTNLLKKAEEVHTANALAAVEKAKKDALDDYKTGKDLTNRPAGTPKITPANAAKYGGMNRDTQLADYLASHELANEILTKRKK